QMVVVLKAFVERRVSLVFGHPFEFSWLDVAQADVFHSFLLVYRDSEQLIVLLPDSRLGHRKSTATPIFLPRQRNLYGVTPVALVRSVTNTASARFPGRVLSEIAWFHQLHNLYLEEMYLSLAQ